MAHFRILLIFLGIAGLARGAELTLLTDPQKKTAGEVVAINADGLTFKTAAGEEKHELTKINVVEIAKEKGPGSGAKFQTVTLVDGSEFRCSDFKIKGKNVEITLLGSNQVVVFPSNRLLYMIRDLSDPKLNQDFRGILSKRGKRDIWILHKDKDQLLDGIPGTFGKADDKGETIEFEMESGDKTVSIANARLYGMIFAPPNDMKISQTICRVVDVNGNAIVAGSIAISEKKSVVVETVTGVKLEYPALAGIARLDFGAGAVQYLSNLNPSKLIQSSTEGIAEPYRRDRNLDNDDIKIGGIKYPKGLALHSRTELTYDLDGQYKIFEAVAGVDDCVEGESKVTLTIEGDFKQILKEVIKKGDKPRALSLPIATVKKLTITVESDFLDLGNQVDLAGAKVRK
jgi:hypothetical protein